VDPEFGDWSDLARLSQKYFLIYDFMINHLSSHAYYFQDFIEKKDGSPYAGMFIRYKESWPSGQPTTEDIEKIYKRKPRAPGIDVIFKDGTVEKIWCRFGDDQIDLNIQNEVTWHIPEMHEHYTLQLKLAEQGYWVYDFALPMLLLHALYTGETADLVHWLQICPRKQFTTLDTYDGIGIVDVRGLLTDEQIDKTQVVLFSEGANIRRIYNTEAYNNQDTYQINCTYYSALGNNDDADTLARAVNHQTPQWRIFRGVGC
jgi:sucrose phosphorylase